ncbi:MAG: hypothetical protein IKL65_00205 [Bacilli bacterium]|nr:hypothetical protein [Bacilli bacterium]
MKIIELKELVDKAYEKGKDCDVEVWLHLDDDEEVMGEIESIGQFDLVPDMTITFKTNEGKVFGSEPLTEEQLNYKNRYEKLKKKICKVSEILVEEE